MLRLTRDDLMHIAPRPKTAGAAATWDAYVAVLTSVQGSKLFDDYEINTPLRANHFLATVCAETNLSVLWESGAYSAAGIMRVFGVGRHSSAITQAEANAIAKLPVGNDRPGDGPRGDKLFERAYGYKTKIGRSMGNVEPGDGARFRGLGPAQLTGRNLHTAAAKLAGCPIQDLCQPINCFKGALQEWKEKNCNRYADLDDAVSIRKLINGGSLKVSVSRINGLPEAQAALRRAKQVITVADFQTDTGTQVAAIIPDVPDSGRNSVPVNSDKPVSLMSSTEMQAGAVGGGTTGVTAGNQWSDCLPRAFEKATASGHFSFASFALALLSDPIAWAAVGATVATGGILYLMLMRYKRFFHFGV